MTSASGSRLRERAQQQGRSFKDVLNRTLRAGLKGELDREPFVQHTASLALRPGPGTRCWASSGW